jgi:hypothetical protein
MKPLIDRSKLQLSGWLKSAGAGSDGVIAKRLNPSFVQGSPFGEQFECRIQDIRLVRVSIGDLEIQGRQITAIEVLHEVAGAERERPVILCIPRNSPSFELAEPLRPTAAIRPDYMGIAASGDYPPLRHWPIFGDGCAGPP